MASALTRLRERLNGLLPSSWGDTRLSLLQRSSGGIGLDVGTRRVKMAFLERSGDTIAVERIIDRPFSEHLSGEHLFDDPDGVVDELVQILDGNNVSRVSVMASIGGEDAVVRRGQLPRAEKQAALRRLPSASDFKLPLQPATAQFDLVVLDPEAEGRRMEVLVVAARKDDVATRQRAILDAGLEIAGVELDAFSLFNLFEHCRPDAMASGPVALIDIGYSTVSVVVVREGSIAVTRNVYQGVSNLVRQMTEGGGVYSTEDAERALFNQSPSVMYPDAFDHWAGALLNEVDRTLRAADLADVPVPLHLSGGGALIEDIDALLEEEYDAPIAVFDPLEDLAHGEGFHPGPTQPGPAQAVALGLALRQAL